MGVGVFGIGGEDTRSGDGEFAECTCSSDRDNFEEVEFSLAFILTAVKNKIFALVSRCIFAVDSRFYSSQLPGFWFVGVSNCYHVSPL